MNLILFLLGNRQVSARPEVSAALLNACLQYGISYRSFQSEEDGKISFFTSECDARKLRKACDAQGIAVSFSAPRGLPAFFLRYRKRVGLMIGFLVMVALLVLSERFVWDIRVTGNTEMTESEVREELKACGFGVGSYIPNFHAGELENRVLIRSDRIAWISIYLDGTVATVQIIERVEATPQEDLSRPANLVAVCDGQIETVELYRGKCVVGVGQAVRKGELLVSGIYDSSTGSYRYTRASGAVYARTERSFSVQIPFLASEKSYGTSVCGEAYLNFFDFSIKIYKNTGNYDETCDIIKREKGLDLFGVGRLPVSITYVDRLPYTETSVSRTPEQALMLAYAQLDRELASLSEDVQLLSKKITTTVDDRALILNCTVSCIENIAVQSEFEISQ